jgi:hypothetical protein
MLVQRQKIVSDRLPAALESHLGDFHIRDGVRQSVQFAQTRGVGDCLDVEGENWNHN